VKKCRRGEEALREVHHGFSLVHTPNPKKTKTHQKAKKTVQERLRSKGRLPIECRKGHGVRCSGENFFRVGS